MPLRCGAEATLIHCNLTRRTGVGGGATPALESAQWAVQSTRKAMNESKDRLSLDLLLKLLAQGQQGAVSQLLLAPLATVGDVSSVGKGLSKYLHLSGTRWFPSLSDSMPLERSLGLRHGSPAARHSTLWGLAQGGGTTWA